ncbi:L-threonylcarbamoyladenylate synthase [Thermocrinis sp.]|uniref:L-threonylcarbamoyladenylate synthase n=1 Tax=Thermocrinis sp. TaxID=2024383 RepID=UPI002FDDAC1D
MEIVSTKDISKVVKVLEKGGIVCAPTDTIYGLLADATNKEAVERLYEIRRPSGRPFIVLLPDISYVLKFDVLITKLSIALLSIGVTVIFPKRTTIPTYLTRWRKSIAFRVPAQGVFIKNLLKKFGKPLVAPSANPEGLKPASDIKEAMEYFGDKIDLYVKGAKLTGKPSTIVKLISKKAIKIIREGNVPKEQVLNMVSSLASPLGSLPFEIEPFL